MEKLYLFNSIKNEEKEEEENEKLPGKNDKWNLE